MNGGFEVPFVPGKVHESDDAVGFAHDFVLGLAFVGADGVPAGYWLARVAEAHEVCCGGGGAAGFDFVAVFHYRRARAAPAVV